MANPLKSGKLTDTVFWEISNSGILHIFGNGAIPNYPMMGERPYVGNLITGVIISEGITNIGGNAFAKLTAARGNVILPDSVQTIHSCAFRGSGFDGYLEFGNGLTEIGARAFEGCNFKGNLIFPPKLYEIGRYAFADCSKLDGVVNLSCPLYEIQSNTFFMCENIKQVIFPSILEDIEMQAFSNCKSINTPLIFPDSLTRIAASAFLRCENVPYVEFGKNLLYIGESSFAECRNLRRNIKIPDKVCTIADFAFFGCNNLDGELIPGKSLQVIGRYAFANTKIHGNIDTNKITTNQFSLLDCNINKTEPSLDEILENKTETSYKSENFEENWEIFLD